MESRKRSLRPTGVSYCYLLEYVLYVSDTVVNGIMIGGNLSMSMSYIRCNL